MNAYQLFGSLFMGGQIYSEDEQVRILDWFSACLEGRPVGDLETDRCPLPAFEGERVCTEK